MANAVAWHSDPLINIVACMVEVPLETFSFIVGQLRNAQALACSFFGVCKTLPEVQQVLICFNCAELRHGGALGYACLLVLAKFRRGLFYQNLRYAVFQDQNRPQLQLTSLKHSKQR